MKKIIFSIFITMLSLIGFSSSYAQEETQQRVIISTGGRVVAMDWVAAKLIVDTGGDEMTFIVPNGLEITKGADKISFADLNINDNLTIGYYDAGFAGLKVVRISVSI